MEHDLACIFGMKCIEMHILCDWIVIIITLQLIVIGMH